MAGRKRRAVISWCLRRICPWYSAPCDCRSQARALAEEMKARYGVKEVYINYIGPVIGRPTGAITMGISFVGTKR